MEASTLTHASRRGLLARRSPILKLEKDDRLVALIRGGHDGAFEILFNRYQPRLLAFCQSMVKSRQDAEDVLQEVFTNAHKAMLADDRKINVRPWLYRIARNRCLNHLRKPVPEGQDSMDIHAHLNGTSTADRVQKREELRQVLNDVGTLPETQRTALLLREIDQLSYEDIAVAMETTIPAVKSLLVRARITLAESSEARTLSCDEVRVTLAEAAEGIGKADGPVRLHVKKCESCTSFRNQLRSDRKALAALFPIGPLALLKTGFLGKIFGGGSTAAGAGGGTAGAGAGAGASASAGTAIGAVGGTAAAGSTATAGGLGAIGGAIGTKAAAGVATAALITAGAVEVREDSDPVGASQPAAIERVATPPPPGKGPKKPKPRLVAATPAAATPAVVEEQAVVSTDTADDAPAEPTDGQPEVIVEDGSDAFQEEEAATEDGAGREAEEDPNGDAIGGTIDSDPEPDPDPTPAPDPGDESSDDVPPPPTPVVPPPGGTTTEQGEDEDDTTGDGDGSDADPAN